jgi:hypothetical protein
MQHDPVDRLEELKNYLAHDSYGCNYDRLTQTQKNVIDAKTDLYLSMED